MLTSAPHTRSALLLVSSRGGFARPPFEAPGHKMPTTYVSANHHDIASITTPYISGSLAQPPLTSVRAVGAIMMPLGLENLIIFNGACALARFEIGVRNELNGKQRPRKDLKGFTVLRFYGRPRPREGVIPTGFVP